MLLWEDLGDQAAAARQFRLLLALAPDAASVHMNYGLFRLAAGAYAEGWAEYEWRWRNEEYDERDWGDRKSDVKGKRVSGRVDSGGRHIFDKKNHVTIHPQTPHHYYKHHTYPQ